jgi:hypothetical protein
MKLGHLNAGVVKITRNITEYGGISRNMAEYHGIYLDITIFFDGSHAKLFINIKHGRLTTYFDYKSNNNNNNKLYLKLFLDHPLSHHIPAQFFQIKYLGEYLPPF